MGWKSLHVLSPNLLSFHVHPETLHLVELVHTRPCMDEWVSEILQLNVDTVENEHVLGKALCLACSWTHAVFRTSVWYWVWV